MARVEIKEKKLKKYVIETLKPLAPILVRERLDYIARELNGNIFVDNNRLVHIVDVQPLIVDDYVEIQPIRNVLSKYGFEEKIFGIDRSSFSLVGFIHINTKQ